MGKPRVTMADVAELANVSKMSVSRVLNNKPGVSRETRQRILNAATHLGYVPVAPTVPHTSSNLVAVLVPDFATIYINDILRGISMAAEQLDYELVLFTQGSGAGSRHIQYFSSMLDINVVAGVLMVAIHNYEVVAKKLREHQIPYIIVDHHGDSGEEYSITSMNRRGMLDAMRHLLALGHRRIGFITGRMDLACSHDRLQGYKDGLAEVGLPYDPDLVREGDFLQPSGFQQAQYLLQLTEPPTAILASNDRMALGAMNAAEQAELHVGQDISIVGFDDIYLAEQSCPPLTTVRQPLSNMGEVALDTLVKMLNGHKVFTLQHELPTELIVRGTTGPAS